MTRLARRPRAFARGLALAAALAVALGVVLLPAPPADANAKKKKTKEAEAKDDAPPALHVESWLTLGPVEHPLPAFADDDERGFDLDALLEAELLPEETRRAPREGEAISWFGGTRPAWTRTATPAEAGWTIAAGGGGDDGGKGAAPRVAWAAVYVSTDRFRKVKLDVGGSDRRRVWLDGEAKGKGSGESVSATLELLPGEHLLLVRTVRDPENEKPWTLSAALRDADAKATAAPAIALDLDPRRPVSLADVIDMPTVSSLAVSPDGRRLALSVRRIVPGTGESDSWIEIRDLADGKVVESWRGRSGADNVEWSPDGRWLSYTAKAAAGKGNDLLLVERGAGSVRPLLTGVERFGGYRWSPAGDAIVYVTSEEGKEFEDGLKLLQGPRDRWSNFRTKSHLNLVRVPDGARRRLTAGDADTSLSAISPDGSKLLFTRQRDELSTRPFTVTELWEMELAGGATRKLREFRWMSGLAWSPDGTTLLVGAQAGAFDGAGINLTEGGVSNSYEGQLFLWNPATDEARAITRDFDPAVGSFAWSRADGRIYLTAEDRDLERLFRYDPQADRFEAIDTGVESFGSLTLAHDAPVAVGTGSSTWKPQRLIAIDLRRGDARTLPHPNEAWAADLIAGDVKDFDFESSTGATIDGRVYYPPGFDAQRKYPTIVYYYGGTSPVGREFGGRYPKEWWAANGYLVYVLQPSGATGFGQDFAARHVNDWGELTAQEIVEGTRKYLAAHPFADPARVGCIGASYGGFMTMTLATKTDLFAAAVSHAGISSLASYWGEGYWGYLYSAVASADAFPWNRRDVYVDKSPLFNADRAQVPILLTHGTGDTNVPVGESDQFYIALKLLGKDVEYLQVEGENHWIADHAKRMRWSRAILAWFDRYLKGQPEWWNAMFGREDEADAAEETAGGGDGARGRS